VFDRGNNVKMSHAYG